MSCLYLKWWSRCGFFFPWEYYTSVYENWVEQKLEQFSREINRILISMTPSDLAAKWKVQSWPSCFVSVYPQSMWLFRDRFQMNWLVPGRCHQSWQLSPINKFSLHFNYLQEAAKVWSSSSSTFKHICLKKRQINDFSRVYNLPPFLLLSVCRATILNIPKVIHYHSNLETYVSKIITLELIDSFACICNVKCLINKLNILLIHKNDDNIWIVFYHLSGICLIRADRCI